MRKILFFIFILFVNSFTICEAEDAEKNKIRDNFTLTIEIGEKNYTAMLYDNLTTREFIKRLPITMQMNDLYANEKYYNLASTLPVNPEQINQIQEGELMLFGENCVVLFYKSTSSTYKYTKLGKIKQTNDLSRVLGKGNIRVIFKPKTN